MGDFLIPGGLYKIYYRRSNKGKGPLPSYKALIILVSFSNGRRIYRYQDLRGENPNETNFQYDAIEIAKNSPFERFTIVPEDIAKAALLKSMKDMRNWPLEAIRVYFSGRGVSRNHTDDLYRGIAKENIDFGRFHVRAALKQRRKQEKAEKKKVRKNDDIWVEAEYTGIDDMGYLSFTLSVADLEDARYRFGKDSDIVSVVFQVGSHIIKCYNENDDIVHRMNPPWPPEVVREALQRNIERRATTANVAKPSHWASYYSTNWTDSSI